MTHGGNTMNSSVVKDEENVHDIQVLDAQAEARYLTNVIDNIMNAQSNRSIMAAVYDVLTGTYVLTENSVRIDADDIDRYLDLMTQRSQLETLEMRLEKYNIPLLSGKGLFSALLPPDFTYTKGKVFIREGVLIEGRITKKDIGNAHGSIIQVLWKEYGRDRTVDFLTDLPFVVNAWLTEYGFSVGLKDCIQKTENHRHIIEGEIEKARLYVASTREPPEDPMERERYEANIVEFLRGIQNLGMRILDKSMDPKNGLRIMIESEAKGSPFNAVQITGLLGQQFLKGERLKPGISERYIERDADGGDERRRPPPTSRYTRTLPYFDYDDRDLEAFGYIPDSFLTGMKPPGLFFHMVAGRENLMDTAIKTSETGSMHHRIVKALESIIVAYDGSVRNAVGATFQMVYGEDSFDAGELKKVATNVGTMASFVDIVESVTRINSRYGYVTLPKKA